MISHDKSQCWHKHDCVLCESINCIGIWLGFLKIPSCFESMMTYDNRLMLYATLQSWKLRFHNDWWYGKVGSLFLTHVNIRAWFHPIPTPWDNVTSACYKLQHDLSLWSVPHDLFVGGSTRAVAATGMCLSQALQSVMHRRPGWLHSRIWDLVPRCMEQRENGHRSDVGR